MDEPIKPTNRRARIPATTADERAPVLEDWTARERRRLVERDAERAAKYAEADHKIDAAMARARAWGCDDGTGMCRICGVQLGADADGNDTHPDNGCVGPLGKCEFCGKPYTLGAKGQIVPTCTPEDHIRRPEVFTLAPRRMDFLAPPRAYKDD